MYKYLFLSLILSAILLVEIPSLDATGFELEEDASTTHTVSPIDKDDRVPCDDPRVGRIMPLGCTGWLISSGCILTAGHCASTTERRADMQWLEFNVPLSALNGKPTLAKDEDRYPIVPCTGNREIIWQNNALGDDWAIFRISKNLRGESAFTRQGQFFRLIDNWSFIGSNPLARVTGYGLDGPAPYYGYEQSQKNERSQTEQTDAGRLIREDISNPPQNIIYYQVDTLNANSGSPVYLPGTHLAIGIHTTGFYPDEEHLNKGTGFKNNVLKNALEDYPLPGTKMKYIDADFFTFPEGDGTIFKPYRKLEDALSYAATGDTLGIVAGHYAHPGISFPKGKKLILKALAGNVRLGSAKYK
jgi:V8-like Glu-specific endopeptidase